ncbi:T9SS type B sorting domain-containing protein [Chryseobacterium sp. T16E-39]|uniref:T9SS type B sorting domain-containing protein n=1 Tax=Chryseobacterium sp. T16E-39 TaxID=2015076 RepID=UPI0012FADF10|nr:T9SS type B sorting domain-containing protein [Chryseobacterium sp. T16E-39]
MWHFQTRTTTHTTYHFVNYSATDSQGNIFVAGNYGLHLSIGVSNISFGNVSLNTNSTEMGRAVVAKLDKNKNVIWVKEIKSDYISNVTSIVIDKLDNLIISGSADGNNLKLNPNTNDIFAQNNSEGIGFITKWTNNGSFIFGNVYRYASSFTSAVDENNDIITLGRYVNYNGIITDFDPDPNVVHPLPAPNGSFIMKNLSNGNFSWAKPIHTAELNCVKVNKNNEIIILGNYNGTLTINTNQNFPANIPQATNRFFLAKFDTTGNLSWFQHLAHGPSMNAVSNSKIAIDNNNNIYTAGTFYEPQSINFTNTSVNLPVGGRNVIYKISNSGQHIWNSVIKADDGYDFLTIALNTDNTINFFVKYSDEIIKVINSNNTEETVKRLDLFQNYIGYGSHSSRAYYLKFRNDGKLIYNKSDFSTYSLSQNIDYEGNIINAGNFESFQDFNPDPDIKEILYPQSYQNSFVQKFGKCYNGTPDGDKIQVFCSALNPTIADLFPKTSYTTWYDSLLSTNPLPGNTLLQNNAIYYASVQDESCPLNTKRLAVTVIIKNSPPTLVVNDFYFCNDVNQMTLNQLNINNNQNIHFYDSAGNQIGNFTNIIPGAQYYVTQYNECESTKVPFKVFSIQGTPPTANTQQTFCAANQPKASDIQITGQNIKWYDAAGNILPATTSLVNGQTYYASQTINGCESNKISIHVTVNNTPKPAANTAQDFCASANPTLANLVVTGTSLVFYSATGNVLPLTTPLVHGQTYFVTQTINGCESEKQSIAVTLSVNNVPAQDVTDAICNTSTGTTISINLHSYEGSIIANPSNYTFSYTDSAGNIISNPSSYIMSIGSTVIHVKVSTPDGCFIVIRLSLTLNPKPKLTLPDQIDFCQGKSVTLDAGNGFTSYLWNTGVTTQTIVVSTPGNYSVKVTNNFGCESIANIQVSYSVLAEIVSVTITNNSATILLSASGNYEYSLDNINWQDSNVFNNLSMGEYIVYVRTKSGCIIGQKKFSIFNIPNTITPNGDGVNDKWRIKGLENYTGTEIGVYDRKGIPVFKEVINKRPFEWDGKYNSTPLITGSYWYIIKVSDGRIYNGWLLIKNRD